MTFIIDSKTMTNASPTWANVRLPVLYPEGQGSGPGVGRKTFFSSTCISISLHILGILVGKKFRVVLPSRGPS